MKKTKKLLALIFCLIFALSAFSIAASAENLLVKHPTTENPMTFSYSVKVTAYDKYGRAKEGDMYGPHHDDVTDGPYNGYVVDFYLNEADYKAKKSQWLL